VRADPRLSRLRELVTQLARLPPSESRERALADARARIVDVETGEVPRAMRPVEEAPPPTPRTAPRRRPEPRVAKPRPAPARPVPEAAPPASPPVPDAPAPPGEPALGSGGLLWLEDQADESPEPGDDEAWKRGLRG